MTQRTRNETRKNIADSTVRVKRMGLSKIAEDERGGEDGRVTSIAGHIFAEGHESLPAVGGAVMLMRRCLTCV